MDTKQTKPCAKCAKTFEFTIYEIMPTFHPAHCVACSVAIQAEMLKIQCEENKRKADEKLAMEWLALCPIRFRDSEESRLPQVSREAIEAWASSETTNLAFIGPAGTCKTRAGFLALKMAHESGERCEAISHSALAETARDAAFGDNTEKARQRMRALQKCDVLFVDDIGKPPSTERTDADFEALIDYRYAHRLPTIWTSNAGGTWLASRFGADRGEPIVRRLAEDAIIAKL